eukprot:15359678-Ditylum_brightwellii.AAC.1
MPEAEKMVCIMIRNITVALEYMPGCIAEKYKHRNSQYPQGSVGIHHSIGAYTYGCSKDTWYCSYIHWKLMGIPNPVCNEKQTRNPHPG